MNGWRHTGRPWIAFFATYVLILQSLAGAHASGLRSTFWQLEQAGAIICVDHGISTLPNNDSPIGPVHTFDCCAPGCGMFAPSLVATAYIAHIDAPSQQVVSIHTPVSAFHPTFFHDGRPGKPRAPPFAA